MHYNRLFAIVLVSVSIMPIACAHNPRPGNATSQNTDNAQREEVLTLVSETLRIDTTYHSMEGPYHRVRFAIAPDQRPDTVWITAMSADVVTPELEALPVEFFCHANLDFDPRVHRELFKTAPFVNPRLFTLSQGHEVMRFPAGFGIPVRTDEPLDLTTQVLSNNGVDAPKNVRVRIKVYYVRNGHAPMKALAMTAAFGAVATSEHAGHFGMHGDHQMGAATAGVAKSAHEYRDSLGQTFSGHWVVAPGKHRVRTVVTKWMNLDRDVHVHYVGVHVHPFAKQITLRDMTTGAEVFTSRISPLEGRIGISKVTDFSSARGLRLDADHHYELIADYENPTAGNVDAMAVLFLYVRDPRMREVEK